MKSLVSMGFSNVADRYGSRLIWFVPFLVLLTLMTNDDMTRIFSRNG